MSAISGRSANGLDLSSGPGLRQKTGSAPARFYHKCPKVRSRSAHLQPLTPKSHLPKIPPPPPPSSLEFVVIFSCSSPLAVYVQKGCWLALQISDFDGEQLFLMMLGSWAVLKLHLYVESW
ncbi:hypothetical protein L2E82_42344 [Cichorium intybus]|uniref:Uncharacterized protein n=1 Tax=Cichorium intybus TaxID=13427 RepID=A0ACB8ZN15_CICIN|nr:hypothetical protein L2E82_42344 [Cichorium intybus]